MAALLRTVLVTSLVGLTACSTTGPKAPPSLVADTDASRASAELNAVADALLAHIRDTNPVARTAAGIPVKKFADLSLLPI